MTQPIGTATPQPAVAQAIAKLQEASSAKVLDLKTPEARAQVATDTAAYLGVSVAASSAAGASLDGLVDEGALLASDSTLASGTKGAEVSALQSSLNAMGANPPLEVDADYGAKTAKAVSDFQGQMGLKVDGKAGPDTKRALAAVEAMTIARSTDDPAEAAAKLQEAADLIAGIQPPDQQVLLQQRLGAVAQDVAAKFDALVAAQPKLVEGGQCTPEDPTGEGYAERTQVDAEVAYVDRADEVTGGDSDGVMAVADDHWIATAPKEAVSKAFDLMSNDGHIDDEEAAVAGKMASRMANEDPEEAYRMFTVYMAGAGGNNGEAFVEAFMAKLSDEALMQIARHDPATLKAMDDKVWSMWNWFSESPASERIDRALEAVGYEG